MIQIKFFFISNGYNYEIKHFWLHVGKVKMRLRGGSFFQKIVNKQLKFFLQNSWMQDPRCKHEYLDRFPKGVAKMIMMIVDTRA